MNIYIYIYIYIYMYMRDVWSRRVRVFPPALDAEARPSLQHASAWLVWSPERYRYRQPTTIIEHY